MSIEIQCHTALHIAKGAIVKVLGEDAKWTTSVNTSGNHGRIAVEFNRKPSEQEIKDIQRKIDMKIEDNSPIEIYQISRKDAEARWGEVIYDKFPLPESIQEVSIFHLPEWNINACNKQHTATTGEVGSISITKTRYRNSKRILEVSFEVK
jgi:alanyl-tRNA synthetase